MAVDARILGRTDVAVSAADLSRSVPRWIICSHDLARGGAISDVVVSASPSIGGAHVKSAFPVSNMVDGNRNSYCETSVSTDYIEFTLDTGLSRRKALMFIEYPAGEKLELLKMQWTNDAAAAQNGGSSSSRWFTLLDKSLGKNPVVLHEDREYALWELPWNQTDTGFYSPTLRALAVGYAANGSQTIRVAEAVSEPGWVTGYVIPQSGGCAGQPRRILASSDVGANTEFTLDDSWPIAIAAGTQMLFVKYSGQDVYSQYLQNRFCRMRIGRKTTVGKEPIRIVGVSLFDFEVILNGGVGAFRHIAAPNPSGVTRGLQERLIHRGLNGSVRFEARPLGEKRTLAAEWSSVYSKWFDVLETYVGRGIVGLVDEESRYMQGYFTQPSSEAKRTLADGTRRSRATVQFIEV